MKTGLPEALRVAIEAALGAAVAGFRRCGGGSICQAGFLDLADGRPLFLKFHPAAPPRFFLCEAASLAALREAAGDALTIPEAVHAAEAAGDAPAFLILQALTEGPATAETDRALGRGLALLHRAAADSYGFEVDNYLGLSPQENGRGEDWPAFFAERRLRPPFAVLVDRGGFTGPIKTAFDKLLQRLPELIASDEPPALVHGDLWSGNILALAGGGAAIIDPAAHYAHREVDLAMTELFGRQGAGFYAAYDEAYPRSPGYAGRRELYNLYHLLNHARLFGGGYVAQSARFIRRFGG